jgi:hypothetical protein
VKAHTHTTLINAKTEAKHVKMIKIRRGYKMYASKVISDGSLPIIRVKKVLNFVCISLKSRFENVYLNKIMFVGLC